MHTQGFTDGQFIQFYGDGDMVIIVSKEWSRSTESMPVWQSVEVGIHHQYLTLDNLPAFQALLAEAVTYAQRLEAEHPPGTLVIDAIPE
jgi:alpha-ketoglutarate-dependent taurine dioxygenase